MKKRTLITALLFAPMVGMPQNFFELKGRVQAVENKASKCVILLQTSLEFGDKMSQKGLLCMAEFIKMRNELQLPPPDQVDTEGVTEYEYEEAQRTINSLKESEAFLKAYVSANRDKINALAN